MKKAMMSIGLVLLMALMLGGAPDLFAQQQDQSQQQQTMQCPMMGRGMQQGGKHGMGAKGMNCPRMASNCPMAKQCPMMQGQ